MQAGEGNGIRDVELRFNTAITYPISSQYTRLEGVRNLFLSKQEMFYEDCGRPHFVENDFMVAGTFAYTLKNWYDENWKILDGWIKDDDLPSLPFGSYNDPLRTLTLNAVFPFKSSSEYQDNPMDTNMTLDTAEQWLLTREFAPQSQQRAFLSTLLDHVITSWVRDPANRDYLPPYDASNDDGQRMERDNNGLVRNLFHAMGPNRRGGIAANNQTGAVAQAEQIDGIVQALFNGQQKFPKLREDFISDTNVYTTSALGYRIKRGTPVPYKSFFWNLMVYSLHYLSDPAKLQSNQTCIGFMRVLWIEVIRQVRWHWEHLERIPNVDISLYDQDDDKTEKLENDYPDVHGIDLRFSILHQKLAMVNCCIQRRLDSGTVARNGNDNQQRPFISSLFDDIVANAEDDDQSDISDSDMFFDPLEDFDGFTEAKRSKPESRKSSATKSLAHPHSMTESFVGLNYPSSAESYNTRRSNIADPDQYEIKDPNAYEGRQCQHPSLRLLKTNEPMFVPVMQDAGFMTEDMIRQQADVFERLGTSESATHIRAKLQSAHLYSDMQAFKAANPHATLEDFVRWHSPRDWIETKDDQGQHGRLSARMADSNNIWQELWKCSTRTPVSRQKPLFDVTAEGEKALHYLETVSIHEVFAMYDLLVKLA
ncbi:Rab3 GTPase-activating protein catalytic subunit-domain-containing protein [Fennellomyces sp. T-0311]|nr:Rab3 GTPase-activating protein catalytic subunit-domain-containing protein [Fennellomyces sp. T-0311]